MSKEKEVKNSSKFSKYIAQIKKIVEENKALGSDAIASMIVDSNPNEKIKQHSLSRYIRKFGLQKEEGNANKALPKYAKILLFDIETAPILAFTWTLYPNAIGTDMVKKDWFMFSWSGKWLFEDKIMSHVLTSKEAVEGDDKRITKALWDALDEADIVVAHNGRRFDVKKSNSRFLNYGLGLPSPYQVVDTLLEARSRFALTSNRLDYIAKNVLGIEGKAETPKGLWWKCYDGDTESLEMMRSYCDKDVLVLEDVYLHIRPYMKNHPNIGLIDGGGAVPICPCCGSDDLKQVGTPYRTMVNEYDTLRCGSCNSISRKRRSNITAGTAKALLTNIPR